jgi:hypothetical protein
LDRYPWIVEAARQNRHQQFVVDGEAVLLTLDGISDFEALHSRKHDEVPSGKWLELGVAQGLATGVCPVQRILPSLSCTNALVVEENVLVQPPARYQPWLECNRRDLVLARMADEEA